MAGELGERLGYRPALDGLRGVAVALVVAYHLNGEIGNSLPVEGGFVGVDLFFVLSGFLITRLLVDEWERDGRISLRSFYRRRAVRLLPALYVMLVVVTVIGFVIGDLTSEVASSSPR